MYLCLDVRNADIPGITALMKRAELLLPSPLLKSKTLITNYFLKSLKYSWPPSLWFTAPLGRGVGKNTVKILFSSCSQNVSIKFCKQDGITKSWLYKYYFIICFFPWLVVFILPNISGYSDSFLNYLVVSYHPNREICIRGVVMINSIKTGILQTGQEGRLRNKTPPPSQNQILDQIQKVLQDNFMARFWF